ncbi:hypothetical protein BUH_0192 [Burkholderia pseudomallei Pakistan 9]|nr:hypothetical protein BUH_0192 [Burkholderia pseudomallei Pakistan 9]
MIRPFAHENRLGSFAGLGRVPSVKAAWPIWSVPFPMDRAVASRSH